MKHRIPITFLFILTFFFGAIAILSSPKQVSADALDSFDPERIISDSNFIDSGSMSTAQIQNFLNQKNSVCLKNFKTLGLYDSNKNGAGDEPYGKGKNVKVSAATLIKQAADLYKISPKVILATLQKEQGLVTRTDCPQWRYNTALGYGCPDTAPCDNSAYGFTRQIDYGVWHFKGFFHDTYPVPPTVPGSKTIAWNPDSRCGGKKINIRNRATAALYSYTPYQPNQYALNGGSDSSYPRCGAFGNRNFFSYYTSWFGLPNNDSDSLFVRCDDGKNYLIESNDNRKRLVPEQARVAWGLSSEDFLDSDYGCNFPAFDIDLSNIVRSRDSGSLYLIDKKRAYLIENQNQASAWGLGSISQTQAQVNSVSITRNLPITRTLPRIVTSDNVSRSDVYLIDNNQRYMVKGTNEGDTTSYRLLKGYDEIPTAVMSVALLQTLTPSADVIDYSLKIGASTYLLDHNLLRRITPNALTHWANKVTPIELSSQSLSLFKNVSSIGDAFYREGTYYKLTGASTLSSTGDRRIAANWSAHSSPLVTRLLTNKILSSSSVTKTETSLPPTNNVRIFICGNQQYMVERYIATKRKIGSAGLEAWRLSNKYFFVNDKGCGYSEYGLPVDDVVRSRSTGKLYKLTSSAEARLISNSTQAQQVGIDDVNADYPQFEGKSINNNFRVIR